MNIRNIRKIGLGSTYFYFLALLLFWGCSVYPSTLQKLSRSTDSGASEKDDGGYDTDITPSGLGSGRVTPSTPLLDAGGQGSTKNGAYMNSGSIDVKVARPDASRDDASEPPVDGSIGKQQHAGTNRDGGSVPVCGNGIQEEGEECDGDSTCGADCRWMFALEQRICINHEYLRASKIEEETCNVCMCTNCMDATEACYASESQDLNDKCTDVVLCGNQYHCVGPACYTPFTCFDNITRNTNILDERVLLLQMIDTSTALGRATEVGKCFQTVCKEPCGW
jgi:hypothetical protein